MSDDQWQKAQEIFHAALERPRVERAAFVRDACGGDDALHEEVETLLRHDDEAGPDFIPDLDGETDTKPARTPSHDGGLDDPMIGRTIGRYHIKSVIGRGGSERPRRRHPAIPRERAHPGAATERHVPNAEIRQAEQGGSRIATGSYCGDVSIWDVQNGERLLNIVNPRPCDERPSGYGAAPAVAFHPSGYGLAVGFFDGTIRMFGTSP